MLCAAGRSISPVHGSLEIANRFSRAGMREGGQRHVVEWQARISLDRHGIAVQLVVIDLNLRGRGSRATGAVRDRDRDRESATGRVLVASRYDVLALIVERDGLRGRRRAIAPIDRRRQTAGRFGGPRVRELGKLHVIERQRRILPELDRHSGTCECRIGYRERYPNRTRQATDVLNHHGEGNRPERRVFVPRR